MKIFIETKMTFYMKDLNKITKLLPNHKIYCNFEQSTFDIYLNKKIKIKELKQIVKLLKNNIKVLE